MEVAQVTPISNTAAVFSDFDFKIFQLQSEIEFVKTERSKRVKFLKNHFDAQLQDFEERWFETIKEESVIPFKEMRHGIRVYCVDREGSTFEISKYSSHLIFSYMMESYDFTMVRSDEFEDIDIQDFHLSRYNFGKDELMKINIVFKSLECLIPVLVKWNREMESLQSEIQIKIFQVNFELVDFDNQLRNLRQQILELRAESMISGNTIDFGTDRYRKFYYKSRAFEFFEQFRISSLSKTGKTCSIEAVIKGRKFCSTAYYPIKDSQKTVHFSKVRVKTLISNLYERK